MPVSVQKKPESHLTAADRKGNRIIQKAIKDGPLVQGNREEAVRWAERMLQLAGFNPGTMDKSFDARTAAAIRAFQTSTGLPATGKLDQKTFDKLKGVEIRVRAHKDGFVGIGQKSGRIEVLEKRLEKLGYDVGARDGIYDRNMARAVKAFAADQKELEDGKGGTMGLKAQEVLRKEAARLSHAPEHIRLKKTAKRARLDRLTAKSAAVVNPDGTRGIRVGDKGRDVQYVKAHLKAAGFDPKNIGGVFDERTEAAVKAFQRRSGLPVTGRVTPLTWKRLAKTYLYAKNGTSPAQYLGERSAAVEKTEKLLRKLGFKSVKADGLFDARTEKAVERFEKKHHLKVDGKVDARDLKAIDKAVDAASNPGLKAIKIARRWLGFHEKGNNGNPFSKYFGRPPEAWCADFVSYCFEKAGAPIGKKGVGICYCPTLASYFKGKGDWHSKPKPGAVVVFQRNGTYCHTGIVTAVKNGKVYTIEGNSGNAVRTHVYNINDPYLGGYGY